MSWHLAGLCTFGPWWLHRNIVIFGHTVLSSYHYNLQALYYISENQISWPVSSNHKYDWCYCVVLCPAKACVWFMMEGSHLSLDQRTNAHYYHRAISTGPEVCYLTITTLYLCQERSTLNDPSCLSTNHIDVIYILHFWESASAL